MAIEHFLAPNLALLIDSLQGSTIEKLGPMIMKRLHDINWEIRDSTLELLSSMVVISSLSMSYLISITYKAKFNKTFQFILFYRISSIPTAYIE